MQCNIAMKPYHYHKPLSAVLLVCPDNQFINIIQLVLLMKAN